MSNKPLIPARLPLGELVGLIAPASPPQDPVVIEQSIEALQSLGFKVKPGANIRKRKGFLAGTDKERASDVMAMFQNPKVRGIVCLRGGYGTPRILPLLDYRVIRENAKVFVGYSDITALNCAFLSRSNLVTFHGPSSSSFTGKEQPAFTRMAWLSMLTQKKAQGGILQDCPDPKTTVVRKGTARGRLVGGNLSLICSLVGTPYLPSFDGKILFLEDVGEAPYRVDRMLTHLLNTGLLRRVKGIAIGRCSDCEDKRAKETKEYRQTVDDVFEERLGSLKVPMVTGLPFGHVPLNATLPFGVMAELDANKGDLIFVEKAVS